MLTPNEVKAIRERVDRATPGPWYTVKKPWIPDNIGTYVVAGNPDPHIGKPVMDCIMIDEWPAEQEYPDYSQAWDDLEFAAHARQDVPALCETCEELRGLVRRMLPAIEILATGKGIEFDQLQMIQLAGKGRAALGE